MLITCAGVVPVVEYLLSLILSAVVGAALSGGNNFSNYTNATHLLERLLDNYDIRLRPGFGGPTLHLSLDIEIASFDSMSEVNMDYTITMYLNQYWTDERLQWSDVANHSMTLSGDFSSKIWVPDTFLANDKKSYLHDVTETNKMLRLHSDGYIEYGMRFTSTLACNMDLRYYPLDSQNCTVEIESYGYTMREVAMYWKRGHQSIRGVKEAEIPQFSILDYETLSKTEVTATGEYQRLSLKFVLKRNIGYFIFQTYLPSILIVMLSWVSFWINHEATSARVALGITTVLTMTTISTGVRSSLPRISYIKAIDIYLVMCFVFVFAALLEYAAVNYTYWGSRAKKKAKEESHKKSAGDPEFPTWETYANESEEPPHTNDTREAVQMSPIPSLRQPGNQIDSVERDPNFMSSFRSSAYGANQVHNRLRNRRGRSKKIFTSIKRRARVVKNVVPRIKDINLIDKYSRIIFPVCFILFNFGYWSYYVFVKPSEISPT